jgi:ABC-type antimicrobial peptide transport system permease subunit
MIAARSRDGRRLTEDIRAVVAATNPNVLIESTQTGKDYAALGLAPWRIAASTASSLGVVGLLLATIGIYGVTAFAVTRRTKEIGIRIALGAKQWNVLGIVLRQGMSVVGAGIAAGFILAAAAGRLLVGFLFGGSALDPLVFASGITLFAAIGFIACYIPSRRATRIDPMNALRNE